MKLIYIANVGLPDNWAHTIQIMKMCQAFSQNGAEVELIVPKRKTEIKEDIFTYYNIPKIFKITRVSCINFSSTSPSSFVYYVRLFSFILSLKFHLFSKKYDILYTRDRFVALFFEKCVFEIHSLPKIVKWFNRKIWKKTRVLVVLTELIKKRLAEQNIPESKILVAGDAVDLKEFEVGLSPEKAKEELKLPIDKKLIGYVGSLKTMSMEKGVSSAILSLMNLDSSYLLCLVGGELKDINFYKNFSKEHSLENRVLFVGNVKHSLVSLYMKALDILVAPFPLNDHYNYYMSPLKIFEYMAAGKPIVASDLPSIREVLNGENSILIKPADPKELAEAIIKIGSDKDFAEKISNQALQDIKKYTWENRAKNIINFIRR
ncbi:MAG: glycosyltransferase [Candidatus Paceibacterota bacterium]|jgi:glycosyltransferase involved in cell wall biosynthesis